MTASRENSSTFRNHTLTVLAIVLLFLFLWWADGSMAEDLGLSFLPEGLNGYEVQILNKVKIKNTKNNAVMTYTLVSDSEANLKEGKIAISTPIAQGLLGKKVGDIVEIKVPSGLMNFEIMDISI